MTMSTNPKVAVISGAANGIGLAALRKFSGNGFRCVGIDSDQGAIERLSRDQSLGEKDVTWICADLMQDDLQLSDLIPVDAEQPDITLVNVVGGSRAASAGLMDTQWSDFEQTFILNIKPAYALAKICLPSMRAARTGRIVNVGSICGRAALNMIAIDYSSAKAALIGFSRKLAVEVAADNILVNTICPGIIATDRIKARWSKRSVEENNRILMTIPLGKLGTAEEVANGIYFLGSTENTFTTGAILDINGGMFLP